MEVPLKTKNRTTIWSTIWSNSTPRHISRENHNSKWCVHPNVHFSTIYSSQGMKQHKCPSTDQWINKMWYIWYIHTTEYHSTVMKGKKAIFSNMEGPRDDHTEWRRRERDKHHMIALKCGIQRNDTKELIYKTRKRLVDFKNKFVTTKGEGEVKDKLGVRDWRVHHSYI